MSPYFRLPPPPVTSFLKDMPLDIIVSLRRASDVAAPAAVCRQVSLLTELPRYFRRRSSRCPPPTRPITPIRRARATPVLRDECHYYFLPYFAAAAPKFFS
jgi:hypothetical protein